MAKVTMTFEDEGDSGIKVTIESEPALPLRFGDLDLTQASNAQQAARLAAETVMGAGGAAQLIAQQAT